MWDVAMLWRWVTGVEENMSCTAGYGVALHVITIRILA